MDKPCQLQSCCNERACGILGQCVFFHDHFKGKFFDATNGATRHMSFNRVLKLLEQHATRRFLLPGRVVKGKYAPHRVEPLRPPYNYPKHVDELKNGVVPHTKPKDRNGKSIDQKWLDSAAKFDADNGYAYSNTHKHINFHEPED